MDKNKEAIKEFEAIKEKAELKALSNISLERPLTENEYKKVKYLSEKYYGIHLKKVS